MLDNTDKLANKKTGSKTGKKMYKILTNVENALEKYLILCVKIKIIIKKIFQHWHVIMQVERLDLYILNMLFKYFNTMFSMRHDHLPGLLLLTSCPSSCSGSPVQDPCVLCFGRKSIRRGGGGVCSNHLYIFHHNQQSKPRPESLFVGLNATIFPLWKAR